MATALRHRDDAAFTSPPAKPSSPSKSCATAAPSPRSATSGSRCRRHARRRLDQGPVLRARVALRSMPPPCATTHDDARAGEFRLLVAHRAGRLVAALPLVAERRKLAGMPARVLRSLADDHSQRFDSCSIPSCADDAAPRARRAPVAHARLGRARAAESCSTPAPPPTRSSPPRSPPACRSASGPRWCRRYLPLPPDVAALDKQLGSKFRGNLRRRAKKLEAEVGPIALERIDGCEPDRRRARRPARRRLRPRGRRLEGRRRHRHRLRRAPAAPATRRLAHAFAARGELACYFLRAGERRVAFHYALVDGDTYYLFKPGFDPALANYGLGHLLVDAVARDLIARGIRELDFLGDDMPWKRDWTDTGPPALVPLPLRSDGARPRARRVEAAPRPRRQAALVSPHTGGDHAFRPSHDIDARSAGRSARVAVHPVAADARSGRCSRRRSSRRAARYFPLDRLDAPERAALLPGARRRLPHDSSTGSAASPAPCSCPRTTTASRSRRCAPPAPASSSIASTAT